MKLTKLRYPNIVYAVLLILVMPLVVQAIEIKTFANMPVEGDFVIGPGKMELFLAPGESSTRDLTITNRTGKPLDIFIDIEDFTGDPETSAKLLGEEKGPYSLRDYIYPEKNNFVLAHGERAVLPVTISIPGDAEPGGLYGAAIVRAELVLSPEEKEIEGAESQVAVIPRLASLFFVRIKGEVDEAGYLKSFTTDKKFYQKGPVNFSFIYENTGSVHLNPYGLVEIKNIMGKKIDEAEITPYFVMPGFLRSKTVAWDQKLAFGRYTALISLNRGYGDIVDQARVSFWVVPIKVLVIALSVIVLLAILIWLFRSKFEIKRKED